MLDSLVSVCTLGVKSWRWVPSPQSLRSGVSHVHHHGVAVDFDEQAMLVCMIRTSNSSVWAPAWCWCPGNRPASKGAPWWESGRRRLHTARTNRVERGARRAVDGLWTVSCLPTRRSWRCRAPAPQRGTLRCFWPRRSARARCKWERWGREAGATYHVCIEVRHAIREAAACVWHHLCAVLEDLFLRGECALRTCLRISWGSRCSARYFSTTSSCSLASCLYIQYSFDRLCERCCYVPAHDACLDAQLPLLLLELGHKGYARRRLCRSRGAIRTRPIRSLPCVVCTRPHTEANGNRTPVPPLADPRPHANRSLRSGGVIITASNRVARVAPFLSTDRHDR